MKQILKLSIFNIALLFIVWQGDAQPQLTFRFDPNPFIGKWEATSRNMSFELIIRPDKIYYDQFKDYSDILLGEMIYKIDGTIIRHIKTDGIKSIFTGSTWDPITVNFLFTDDERKIGGSGELVIDKDNPKRATWKLRKREMWVYPDWNKVDFDIPAELEWTKIE